MDKIAKTRTEDQYVDDEAWVFWVIRDGTMEKFNSRGGTNNSRLDYSQCLSSRAYGAAHIPLRDGELQRHSGDFSSSGNEYLDYGSTSLHFPHWMVIWPQSESELELAAFRDS